MPRPATVRVGYKGQDYDIPAEISEANARQPGIAAAYIEDMLAGEANRAAAVQAKNDQAIAEEFSTVKTRLSQLEMQKAVINNLTQENSSLKAANEALMTRVAALEESGGALQGANAEARQASYDLSNASTVAIGTLATLQTENEKLQTTVEAMQQQLDAMQSRLDEKTEETVKLGQTRLYFQQQQTNRLVSEVGRVEELAAKAEAQAAQALQTAENARRINDGTLTKADIKSLVDTAVIAEVAEQGPAMLDQLYARDKQIGVVSATGQTTDRDFAEQRYEDAVNFRDASVSVDGAQLQSKRAKRRNRR